MNRKDKKSCVVVDSKGNNLKICQASDFSKCIATKRIGTKHIGPKRIGDKTYRRQNICFVDDTLCRRYVCNRYVLSADTFCLRYVLQPIRFEGDTVWAESFCRRYVLSGTAFSSKTLLQPLFQILRNSCQWLWAHSFSRGSKHEKLNPPCIPR